MKIYNSIIKKISGSRSSEKKKRKRAGRNQDGKKTDGKNSSQIPGREKTFQVIRIYKKIIHQEKKITGKEYKRYFEKLKKKKTEDGKR